MDKHTLSNFKFNRYTVDFIDFQINKDYLSEQSVDLDFGIDVSAKINKEKMDAILTLEAHVFNDISNKKYPFSLNVSITGYFSAEGFMGEDEFLKFCKINGTAILFPFLRSTIADITRTANVEPLVLPLINIYSFLEKDKCKSQDSRNQQKD